MTPILVARFVRILSAGRQNKGREGVIPDRRVWEVWDHVVHFKDVFDTVWGDQIWVPPGGPME